MARGGKVLLHTASLQFAPNSFVGILGPSGAGKSTLLRCLAGYLPAFAGEVRYARDAFEGLRLMDALMAVKRGEEGAALPAPRERRVKARGTTMVEERIETEAPRRSDVAVDIEVPAPPFWGDRIVKGISLADVAAYLDERATFMGQWGLKGSRAYEQGRTTPLEPPARSRGGGISYEELVETEGRPRLRAWLDRIQTDAIAEFAVVYGYWPCYSEGNELVVLRPGGDASDPAAELQRFDFPRQTRGRFLCLADFFRDRQLAALKGPDVVAFHLVTMGSQVAKVTASLFEQNAYRDYLELHGLSVQLTEALAEECAAEGIWVNSVAPSILDTEANRRAMPDADHTRWPSVDEVASTIVFLASPQNLASRGGNLPVYGRA